MTSIGNHMHTADEIIQIVEAATLGLRRKEEPEISRRPAPGKWSKKEILGHLVDTASNYHQRIVRSRQGESRFISFDQDQWVALQHYQEVPWLDLVELFRLYHLHLAHVIRLVPTDHLQATIQVSDDPPKSISDVIDFFLWHLKHHLEQIGV